MVRKRLRHNGTSVVFEHVCGRIGNDPGTSGNSKPGSDPSTPTHRKPRLDVIIDLSCDACVRDAAIDTLHSYRLYCEKVRAARIKNIQAARRCGLTNAQIGEALGMTEAGIRMALKRADA